MVFIVQASYDQLHRPDVAMDNVAVIEFLFPSVFRAVVSLHPTGEDNTEAILEMLLPYSTFHAYVVGKEDFPGIVVLQEWWGVDFEIKNHAVKISELAPGFKALKPEFCGGDEGGGFSQRRQGQLLCHDEVPPILPPDCCCGKFDAS